MTYCLNERTLFLLSEGDGRPRERQHLAACAACQGRQRALLRAADVAGRVLLAGPWPEGVAARHPSLAWLVPATMALAAVLVLAWVGLPRQGAPGMPTARQSRAYAALSLRDVSDSIFADDVGWRVDQDVDPDADQEVLQAALDGDWPCDGADRLVGVRCD